MESGYLATDSIVRAGCSRTEGIVRRKLVVIRDASDFGVVVRACDAGAAATARSAHSAVATTITAITCLVRRIVYWKIGQSIEMPPVTVKATRAADHITTPRAGHRFAKLTVAAGESYGIPIGK